MKSQNPVATGPEPVPDPNFPHSSRQAFLRLSALFRAARPHQWIKNLVCFAGLIFSGRLIEVVAIRSACLAFFSFSLAASGIYLINDVYDRRADRENPLKRRRPIASGLVPVSWALVVATALLCSALVSAGTLPRGGLAVLLAYITLGVAYSALLKRVVLLDVMVIAVGFVFRVLFGVYAVSVEPSPWIVLCMFFLALFLGFSKRRAEMVRVGDARVHLRPVLHGYDVVYLNHLLSMTAVLAILSYALYTVLGRPGDSSLVVTVPLVVFGIFHYLHRVIIEGIGETPELHVVRDPITLLVTVLWLSLCLAILYGNLHLFSP